MIVMDCRIGVWVICRAEVWNCDSMVVVSIGFGIVEGSGEAVLRKKARVLGMCTGRGGRLGWWLPVQRLAA